MPNYVDPGYVRTGYIRLDSDTQGDFTFDGAAKLIIVGDGVTSISVVDMYSRWKDWQQVVHLEGESNAKWPLAFRYVGGDPTQGQNYIIPYFFLQNGWRVRPYEGNHTLEVNGTLLADGGGDPYASTVGAYNVRVQATVPLTAEAITVETGVSGLTPEESSRLMAIPTTTAPTALDNAAAVWAASIRTLTEAFPTGPSAVDIAAAILAAAQATPIHSDVKRINGISVKGSGKEGDTWGPV